MKKLMIAAAIVCAAAMSQAASINWNTGAKLCKNQDGSNLSPKQVIYIMQTDITGETGYQAFLSALAADDFDSSKMSSWAAYAGELTTTSSTSTKSYGKGNGTATATAVPGGAGEYDAHQYSAILFQKDADGKEYYLLSDTTVAGKAKDPNDAMDAAVDAQFTSAMFGTSTWTELKSSDVPEPTSAMLLLLGVAGLALKRKRA